MNRILEGLLKKLPWKCGEKGMTMLEGLISIAILGGVVITMVFAMSGGALAVKENGQEVTVQNLARNQMEYIKGYPYSADATTYPKINTPSGYSISVGVKTVPNTDNNIQKVTANISRNNTLLMTISDYKVNR
jgi:type II secretory pathway pseudopilin PulG